MIYVNSEGKEMDTKDMNPNHLVNALVKSLNERFTHGHGSPERQKAIVNVEHLTEEILIRLNKK